MDLGPLLAVEQAADALVARAVACLAGGEARQAVELLSKAWGLKADPGVRHLRGFACAWCAESGPADAESGPSPTRGAGPGFFEFCE
jgi:hypothetical protein